MTSRKAPILVSHAIGAASLALAFILAWAQPAAAEFFSATDGFKDGAPTFTFELAPYLYLPNVNGTIGLGRPSGEDIDVDRPRPTVASLVPKLNFAFDCDCLARYGNWSAELNFIYISVKQQTVVPPLPPNVPQATLNTKLSTFYVSPGIGYRILSSESGHWDVDYRMGFTYAGVSADSDFAAGEFSASGSHTIDFIQPWIGGRFDYYPTRRWRLQSTAAATGLGVDNGSVGWNAKGTISYLFTSWFDVELGYGASETYRDPSILPDGTNRTLRLLLYGPIAALGFRF